MNPARVPVRDAVPDDAAQLCTLWADLITSPGGGPARTMTAPEEHVVVARVQEIAASPARRLLVAEVDGRIAGAAVCTLEPLTPLHEEDTVRVSYLHVLAERRRRGVGHALMSAATVWAVESGAAHLSVDVDPADRASHRFLARLGLTQLLVVRTAPVPAVRRRLAADTVTALTGPDLLTDTSPGLPRVGRVPAPPSRLRTVRDRITLREAARGPRERPGAAGR